MPGCTTCRPRCSPSAPSIRSWTTRCSWRRAGATRATPPSCACGPRRCTASTSSACAWRSARSAHGYPRLAMAKGKKRKAAPGDVATNRQASYRYDLLDKLEAGIVLTGTEVKSLRDGSAQIKDGYAQVRDGELWLHN